MENWHRLNIRFSQAAFWIFFAVMCLWPANSFSFLLKQTLYKNRNSYLFVLFMMFFLVHESLCQYRLWLRVITSILNSVSGSVEKRGFNQESDSYKRSEINWINRNHMKAVTDKQVMWLPITSILVVIFNTLFIHSFIFVMPSGSPGNRSQPSSNNAVVRHSLPVPAELHIDTNTLTYCQFTVFDSPCCWTVPKRKINTQRKLQANATQKDWNEAGIQRPNLWPSCCKTGRLTLPPLCGPSVTLNWTGKCLVLYKNESIELSVTKCSHASFLCIKIKEKRWNKSFF